MAEDALFAKHDVHSILDVQKRRIREAYLALPDSQADDEDAIRRLKTDYMLNVPTLRPREEWYGEEGRTKIDVRRLPNRIVFPGAGPMMEEFPELTFHIPFDGDPGVFKVAPSAYNSRIARGEVVGQEVLVRVVVIDDIYDLQAHIDREVGQINWALNSLRENMPYFSQELENVLRQAVQNRKRSMTSRASAIGKVNIALRKPTALPVAAATPAMARPQTQPEPKQAAPNQGRKWDVFISHASEDKLYVEPLVEALKVADIDVWYDRLVLEWGDDLRKKIDHGLANCQYGIVVFSKAFLGGKKWTDHEFNGLFALEKHGRKLILPIWHGISGDELLEYSPAFASRLAKDSSNDSYEDIRDSLLRLLDRPIADRPINPVPQQPSQEGETVADVMYYAPNGERPVMYVRKSANRDDWFILHYVDGTIEEGSKQDIAIKYTIANKRLIMSGYKHQNVSGGSLHPEFNL